MTSAADIADRLRVFRDGEGSCLDWLLGDDIQSTLDSQYVFTAMIARHPADGAFVYERSRTTGTTPAVFTDLQASIDLVRPEEYAFHPFNVSRPQQNRAITLDRIRRDFLPVMAAPVAAVWSKWRLDKFDLLRVVITDGPRAIAFVGAFRLEKFDERERRWLQAIAQPLQRRLLLEERLGGEWSGLELATAALEDRPMLAMLVSRRARRVRIEAANAIARAALAHDARGLFARIEEGLAGRGDLEATHVSARGTGELVLVIQRRGAADVTSRRVASEQRWALSPRQSEVAGMLAQGLSNKEIAARLGCVEGTVELHVTQVLRKADVDSRARFVAKFWTELDD